MHESFASVLAEALRTRRLSQTEVALRVPCSPTTISHYCASRGAPSRETLGALVEALGDYSPALERRLYHALGYATPAELASDVIVIAPPDLAVV